MLTIADARTRTLIGFGTLWASRSAVWSLMSMSILMALLGMVVAVVMMGTSSALPGPPVYLGAPSQPRNDPDRTGIDPCQEHRTDNH